MSANRQNAPSPRRARISAFRTGREGSAKPPLHALQVELGAQMMPVDGYGVPEQFSLGVMREFQHAKAFAGLFDMYHRGQVMLRGQEAFTALNRLVEIEVNDLELAQQCIASVFDGASSTNENLGIARVDEDALLLFVCNTRRHDLISLLEVTSNTANVGEPLDHVLLALIGPCAWRVLARLAPEIADLAINEMKRICILGVDCFVGRPEGSSGGHYEISIAADRAETFARLLLTDPEVRMIGLGAWISASNQNITQFC